MIYFILRNIRPHQKFDKGPKIKPYNDRNRFRNDYVYTHSGRAFQIKEVLDDGSYEGKEISLKPFHEEIYSFRLAWNQVEVFKHDGLKTGQPVHLRRNEIKTVAILSGENFITYYTDWVASKLS